MDIGTGLDHLKALSTMGALTENQSAVDLKDDELILEMIGTTLSGLYQAATCHRKCHGGLHILEALCGRMYNLGAAAYILSRRGYYDEALNLTRSIGEISNLISLFGTDDNELQKWLASDKKTRLGKFSPAEVRKKLEGQQFPMLADHNWYSHFCEAYTHVHPGTKPNMHNDAGKAFVGGVFQSAGLAKSLGELATALGVVAMIVSQYFSFDDLFDEISRLLNSIEAESALRKGKERKQSIKGE